MKSIGTRKREVKGSDGDIALSSTISCLVVDQLRENFVDSKIMPRQPGFLVHKLEVFHSNFNNCL